MCFCYATVANKTCFVHGHDVNLNLALVQVQCVQASLTTVPHLMVSGRPETPFSYFYGKCTFPYVLLKHFFGCLFVADPQFQTTLT